jgi:Immunity protein 40
VVEHENLVPDCIPESLVGEGVIYHFSMAHLRPDNIAWKKEPAIEVIEILADHGYAILGGDVLDQSEGKLGYSGDYWDLLDDDVVLWEEYVGHTEQRSIDFIEDVARRKGGSLFFTVFFIDERSYRAQMRDFGNVKYR